MKKCYGTYRRIRLTFYLIFVRIARMFWFNLDTTESLQEEYRDIHTALYGFAPQLNKDYSEREWNNPRWLKLQIKKTHHVIKKLKKTPEGRSKLLKRNISF